MFLNKINKYRKVEFQVKKSSSLNGSVSNGHNSEVTILDNENNLNECCGRVTYFCCPKYKFSTAFPNML